MTRSRPSPSIALARAIDHHHRCRKVRCVTCVDATLLLNAAEDVERVDVTLARALLRATRKAKP
jgi:ferredoxin